MKYGSFDIDAIKASWHARIVSHFWRAESFIVNAIALCVGILPDLINLAITNWSMIDVLPTFTPNQKLYLFGGANALAMILRARKQKNMPQEVVPVAVVSVPDSIDVGTAEVKTQVEKRV